ncbi:MAG: hypothetical protein JWN72_2867 [Thermoleophilia bacterium]|nr:hypothetical protein [Thermoleophilia bacterium]
MHEPGSDDVLAPESAPNADGAAFSAAWLPLFERAQPPTTDELDAFVADCYECDMVVVFDWVEWRDQGHVLLETSGAMERASLRDLQQLLTLLVRQERFAEGTLDHAVGQGWIHRILDRMRAVSVVA